MINARANALSRGIWSLIDHAAITSGIFLGNIMIARQLDPSDYGQYVLLLGALNLLIGVSGALINYPLTLDGASSDDCTLAEMSARALTLAVLLCLITGPVLASVAGMFGSWDALPVLLLALVTGNVQGALRARFVTRLQYQRAVWGDVVSQQGQVLVLFGLWTSGALTVVSAFAAMAVSNAASIVVQQIQSHTMPSSVHEALALIAGYWARGKWLLLSSYLNSAVTLQVFPWTLATLKGASSVANLQTAITAGNIALPVTTSISSIIIPAVAGAANSQSAFKDLRRYGSLGAAVICPMVLVMALWPERLLALFYGEGSGYVANANLVRVFALVVTLKYISAAMSAFLQGLNRARAASRGSVISFLAAILICFPLCYLMGELGAALGIGATAAVTAAQNLAAIRAVSWRKPANSTLQLAPLCDEMKAKVGDRSQNVRGISG